MQSNTKDFKRALKNFKVKTRETIFGKVFEALGKFFKKRPKIIDLNEKPMEPKCIMIGNHNGAGGPFHYRVFLKKRFMTWGAHPMCEGFNSRRKYLYHTFYRQKLGYSKFKSFFLSIAFGLISGFVYNYAGIIPIYYDARIFKTYKYSMQCLEKDISVFVFPEDSDEGYKGKIDKFWPGFLQLAKLYNKRNNTDIPIYTLYYNKKPKTIVVGKPMYLGELLKDHDEEGAMNAFKDYLNSLSEMDFANTPESPEKIHTPEKN